MRVRRSASLAPCCRQLYGRAVRSSKGRSRAPRRPRSEPAAETTRPPRERPGERIWGAPRDHESASPSASSAVPGTAGRGPGRSGTLPGVGKPRPSRRLRPSCACAGRPAPGRALGSPAPPAGGEERGAPGPARHGAARGAEDPRSTACSPGRCEQRLLRQKPIVGEQREDPTRAAAEHRSPFPHRECFAVVSSSSSAPQDAVAPFPSAAVQQSSPKPAACCLPAPSHGDSSGVQQGLLRPWGLCLLLSCDTSYQLLALL